jgi:DNA-binding MarR family transcriptional regulator
MRPVVIINIEQSVAFVTNRTAYLFRRTFAEAMRARRVNLSPEELIVLALLWNQDGMRQGSLARYAIRDRTTLTRLLDGMVRKKLIRREPDPDDRRVVRTVLSGRGRRLEEKLQPMFQELRASILDGVPERDITTMLRTLRRIQDNLNANGT